MQLYQLKPKNKLKKIKRIGRGGKRGTYCGRGQNGQNARSGNNKEPMIRNFLKRYPKLRGYNQNVGNKMLVTVSLKNIEKNFNLGGTISPKILIKKGLVEIYRGKIPKVKILGGDYSFSKKLEIVNCLFSKKAKKMIEKMGGDIKN